MMEERLQVYVDPEKAVFSGIEGETIVLTLQNPFAETILYQVHLESEHEFEIDRPRGEISPLHRMDLKIRLVKPDVELLNCAEKMVLLIWRKTSREKRTRRITVLVRGTSSELTRRKRPPVTSDNVAFDQHVVRTEHKVNPDVVHTEHVATPEVEKLSNSHFVWIASSLVLGLVICSALFMLPTNEKLPAEFLCAQACISYYRIPLTWLVATTTGFVAGFHTMKWKSMPTS